MFLTLDDVKDARDRVEAWLADKGDVPPVGDIALVCRWTREWDHACVELNDLLELEKAEAMRRKVRDEQRD